MSSISINCSLKGPRRCCNTAGADAEPDWAGPAWLIIRAALKAAKIRSVARGAHEASANAITPSGGGRTGAPFHPITAGSSAPRGLASRWRSPGSANSAAVHTRSRKTSRTENGRSAGSVRPHARSAGSKLSHGRPLTWHASSAERLSACCLTGWQAQIPRGSAAWRARRRPATRVTRPPTSGSGGRQSTKRGARPFSSAMTTPASNARNGEASSMPITSSRSRSTPSFGLTWVTAARCASRATGQLTPTARRLGVTNGSAASYLGTGTGY